MIKRTLNIVASRKIAPSDQVETVLYREGGLNDIIKVIISADEKAGPFTKDFAPLLKGPNDLRTLHNIWRFVRKNIRYVADQSGHEKIKSPGATWASKYADCKGMSVFVGSVLRNLGYKYAYRVVFYDESKPERGHIYPVVFLNGEEVIVDAVHYSFNEEVPYWKGYNYDPATGQRAAIQGTPPMNWGKWLAIGTGTLFLFYNGRKNTEQ